MSNIDVNNREIKKGDFVVVKFGRGQKSSIYEVMKVVVIKGSWYLQTMIGKYNNPIKAWGKEELLIIDF